MSRYGRLFRRYAERSGQVLCTESSLHEWSVGLVGDCLDCKAVV